jgi:hypothetical protein
VLSQYQLSSVVLDTGKRVKQKANWNCVGPLRWLTQVCHAAGLVMYTRYTLR